MARNKSPYKMIDPNGSYGFDPRNPYNPVVVNERLGSDSFNDLFGLGDKRRDRQMQLLQSALDYDAQLAMYDMQNEYNDPLARVERERAAGLNPDLVGLDAAGDAAGAPTASLGQFTPDTSPAEMAAIVSGMMSTVLDSGLNVYSSILDANGQNIANNTAQVNLDNLRYQSMLGYLGNSVDPSAISYDPSTGQYSYNGFLHSGALSGVGAQYGLTSKSINAINSGNISALSKSQFKKYARFQQHLNNLAPNGNLSPQLIDSLYSKRSNAAGARVGYATNAASVGFGGSDNSLIQAISEIAQLQYDLEKSVNSYQKQLADNGLVTASTEASLGVPELQAETNQAVLQSTKSQAGLSETLNAKYHSFVDKISKRAAKGDPIAAIVMILLQMSGSGLTGALGSAIGAVSPIGKLMPKTPVPRF